MPVPRVSAIARPVGVAVALGGFVGLTVFGNLSPTPLAAQPPAGGGTAKYGNLGCGGARCHNEKQPADAEKLEPWKTSETHFNEKDPHRSAYGALSQDVAKRMMALLGKHGYKVDANGGATQEVRCLACHTTPALAWTDREYTPDALNARNAGISCETCHGPSKDWASPATGMIHQTFKAEPAKRDQAYDATGMVRLYDINVRANVCVGCHVGAPADKDTPVRDMNHDMIAAGHPRLNFDLNTYTGREKPHWAEKDRSQKDDPYITKDYLARRWVIGRLAQAEAAVALHADRVSRPATVDGKPVPKPELSDMNCFACHHSVGNGWRGDAVGYYAGRTPGAMYWTTPAITLQPGVLTEAEIAAYRKFAGNPGGGDSAAAAVAALSAARKRATDGKNPTAGEFLKLIDLPSPALQKLDWDQAQELFFAHSTLFNEVGRPDDLRGTFQALLAAVPPVKVKAGETGYNSPVQYTPDAAAKAFKVIQDRLRTTAGQ